MRLSSLTLLISFTLAVITSCESQENFPLQSSSSLSEWQLKEEFKQYWYQGLAELTTFNLEQVRYGEVRKGLATIVFVTEDISKSRYVKLDDPERAGKDKVSVLKFNLNKKFITGIYDYALMQSVFKPVNLQKYPQTLRVTTANIEWCGQFLTSARLKKNGYQVNYQSYFDGEEDTELHLPYAMLEDEIWNLIRMAPDRLPLGKVSLIPGILTQELTHQKLNIEQAECTLLAQDSLHIYTIDYPTIARKLKITFEPTFPYRIVAWEETFQTVSGWGMESKIMTTKATRIKYTLSDYWEKKFIRHEGLRKDALGIID